MSSPPPSPSSLSTSKSNTLRFLRKRLLDTFDFKSNKVSKRGNNTHKITIPIPILITNPNRYYEDGEWMELVKESTIIIDENSQSDHALFRYKPPPRRASTIDNVLSSSLASIASPIVGPGTLAFLASTPGTNIQFSQENINEWKDFFYSYACGNFNPSIIPKKPARFRIKKSKTLDVFYENDLSINTIDPEKNNFRDDVVYDCREENKKLFGGNDDDDDDDDDDDNCYLPPPMPPNETERRRALWRFKILNTSKDINFNRIVALIKEHFKVSISLISLVNTTEQWFKSEDGMGCSDTTRDISFCGHAILQNSDEPFVVPDAALDWRFRNNPLVTDAPYIRFYAGAPLRTADGFNIGTVCVIDTEPKDDFSDKERENLKCFAKIVMRELELWVDTLRLRVRNKMQESIAEFSKFCLEAQLANNGGEKKRSSATGVICDPMMKQLFNKAVQLMRDTLDVDSVCLLEMPCLYSRPVSLSSSGFFLNYPLSDAPTRNLKSLASAGGIELSSEALKSSMNLSYFAYLMQTHSQGYIYQNDLPSLPSLFPSDVHSGIVVPIFDNSQNAFGFLIAMTKDSQRQFEEEERVYLNNFGVNVVSEVLKRRVIVADKAKGDFISSISHELRTPLHGILASCELMDESKLNDAQLELIKTIQGCGTSLISIINSVLDFAKLESENHDDTDCPLNQCDPKKPKELETDKTENKSEIIRHRSCNGIKKKKGRVDLVKLLEEVAEACYVGQQMVSAVYGNNNKMNDPTNDLNDNINNDNNELLDANGTGITQASRKRVYELLHPHQFQHINKSEDVLLMIDVEPRDAGWFVMAEDGAVKQMLMNIIGNSLKFTQKGYVCVSLSEVSYSPLSNQYKRHVGEQDAPVPETSKVHALLTITDTGCGISRSFLDTNIFQPFSQENSLQVGTGLGLSIVKLLVEKMGGELAVESEVNVGTRVRIWLNFDLAPSIVPEVDRGLGCDDFDYNSDNDVCVDEAEEKQRQMILEGMKQKTVVVKFVKTDKLKEVVVRYFNNWLRVKELICEEDGSDIEGDMVVIIDNINQLKKMLSKVDSKLTPIVFTTTLAKHGKIAEFVEKIQREIEQKNINSEGIKRKRRKVVILTRPCGPRKLNKAIASVFSDVEEENVIKTSTTSDNGQNSNKSNYKINLSSPEQTLISRNQSSSITSTPNIVINENDNSSSKHLVPPSRPTLNRSITLPNIPLLSKVNEPKFLPVPKSKRLSPPSPTSMSVSLRTSSSSESLNKPLKEIKKSKSTNSLRNKPGPRVLVVEDNAVNRMILSTFLKKRDIRYEEAENGAIGVEKFRKALEEDIEENPNRRGFDVVLMDIQMPVMNGNVATAEIRKIEKELKHPNRFSFSSASTFTQGSTTLPSTPEIDVPINESDTAYPSYINNNTRPFSAETNDYLNSQRNKLMTRRVSTPDAFSFQTNQNNHFSISNLLKPKMTIQLPTNLPEGLSPLPSPIPSSPSFASTSSRSLIFALTGLASEEDKDNAYESGVDGFLTKPVSLKMLDKVLQKWSERNESSGESSSVGSSSSGGSTD